MYQNRKKNVLLNVYIIYIINGLCSKVLVREGFSAGVLLTVFLLTIEKHGNIMTGRTFNSEEFYLCGFWTVKT